MASVIIDISIPAHEFIALYQGTKRDVQVIARDGTRVRFPANHLRQFVTRSGVEGSFRLEFSRDHRFLNISQIS
ncbi:MAG: hypothetical protein CMQ05_01070 [Gammaproteobacteria bacterium]|nr:hypothetical protein [Gammaproteobacteria bacterium]RPG25677.1 MAG: DUF2835 family protein [Gammaproteobacteria bacterium TMED50]|tara:strand:- start:1795 stop:2016 length:222 start_codon:yes stop_codon:yes gene_type:complete